MHKYAVGQKVKVARFCVPWELLEEKYRMQLGAEGIILKQLAESNTFGPLYKTSIPTLDGEDKWNEYCFIPIDDTCTRFLASLTAAPKKEPSNV